jgi:hypothetical protein
VSGAPPASREFLESQPILSNFVAAPPSPPGAVERPISEKVNSLQKNFT